MKKGESDLLQGCPFSSTFESKHEQPYFVFIGADVLLAQLIFQLTFVPIVLCFAANCCTATWSTMAPLFKCRLVFFDVPHAVKDHLPCDKVRQTQGFCFHALVKLIWRFNTSGSMRSSMPMGPCFVLSVEPTAWRVENRATWWCSSFRCGVLCCCGRS